MNFTDLKHKTEDELKAELVKLKKEQFNLRFQKSSGQLENSSKIQTVRRDIARVHTALSEQKRRMANACLLYTSPSPRDLSTSRMPSSA